MAYFDDSLPAGNESSDLAATTEAFAGCDADKFLICARAEFDEMKQRLVAAGVNPDKVVDIEYLRFDKL